MTVSHKAAYSLIISVLLVAGFVVPAYTGLFGLVETRFYNPSVIRAVSREVAADADIIQELLTETRDRFAASLTTEAVRRSFLPNRSAGDIFERSRLYGLLLETQRGLQSVRFVDAGGERIHYSTREGDILRQDEGSVTYRNYAAGELPFAALAVRDQGSPKITLDQAGGRLIFSEPFYDSLDAHRGTALFSLSLRAIPDRLLEAGRLAIGEDVAIIPEPAGIVSGLPQPDWDALLPLIAGVWRDGDIELTPLYLAGGAQNAALVLISAKTGQGIYIGRLVPNRLLAFSPTMRLLLLAVFFITTCLTVFLLFNIRRDPMAIVQNRLRRLRASLINEYRSRGEETDRGRGLEQRREDVRAEIKRGIGFKKTQERDIDLAIDRSWSEVVAIIGAMSQCTAFDETTIVNRVLTDAGNQVTSRFEGDRVMDVSAIDIGDINRAAIPIAAIPIAEDLEELEGIEESELVEEVEPLNDDEPLEEAELLEELEPAETAEDVGELAALEKLGEPEDAPSISENDIAKLASTIEFSPLPEDDTPAGDIPELEIVSPFDTMLSDLPSREHDDLEPDGSDEKKNATLNSPTDFQNADLEFLDAGYQMSLIYPPFAEELSGNPPDLAPVPEGIIESRNGIAYINTDALGSSRDTAQSLDVEFKDLVDSVLRKVSP